MTAPPPREGAANGGVALAGVTPSSLPSPARASERARALGPRPGWPGRLARLSALAALVTTLVLLEAPLCPTAALARVPCPGCGLTRATLALAALDLERALALHPLVPVLAPLVVGLSLHSGLAYLWSGDLPVSRAGRSTWGGRAWLGLAIVVLGVWLARFFGAFGGPAPV